MTPRERLIGYLPPYYATSRIVGAVLDAAGQELDAFRDALDEVLVQQFVATATWGLDLWEAILGLPNGENLSLDDRRSRVLSKQRGTSARPLTVLRAIAPELWARWGGNVFSLVLPVAANTDEYDLWGALVPTLELRRPAHTAYAFELQPPDPQSGYTVFGEHRVRGLVGLAPESGAVYAGRWPRWSGRGAARSSTVIASALLMVGVSDYSFAGVSQGARAVAVASVYGGTLAGSALYRPSGIPEPSGFGSSRQVGASITALIRIGSRPFRACGTFRAGEAA